VVADVLTIRASREQVNSAKAREQAEADLDRVHRAALRIRRMTELYVERLEGRRARVQ
jgi:hypothetical protein